MRAAAAAAAVVYVSEYTREFSDAHNVCMCVCVSAHSLGASVCVRVFASPLRGELYR